LSQIGQDNHNEAGIAFDDVKATSRGGMDSIKVVEKGGKSSCCETTRVDNHSQIVVLLAHPHVSLHEMGKDHFKSDRGPLSKGTNCVEAVLSICECK
jgi:hypothetical protein